MFSRQFLGQVDWHALELKGHDRSLVIGLSDPCVLIFVSTRLKLVSAYRTHHLVWREVERIAAPWVAGVKIESR